MQNKLENVQIIIVTDPETLETIVRDTVADLLLEILDVDNPEEDG